MVVRKLTVVRSFSAPKVVSAALDEAAAREGMSFSGLVSRIARDWLRVNHPNLLKPVEVADEL